MLYYSTKLTENTNRKSRIQLPMNKGSIVVSGLAAMLIA